MIEPNNGRPFLEVPAENMRGKLVVWVTYQANIGDFYNALAVAAALHPRVIKVVHAHDHFHIKKDWLDDKVPHFAFINSQTGELYYEPCSDKNTPDVIVDSNQYSYCASVKEVLPSTVTVRLNMPDVMGEYVGGEEADISVRFSHQIHPEETMRPNNMVCDLVPTRINPRIIDNEARKVGDRYSNFLDKKPIYTVILGERADKSPELAEQDMQKLAAQLSDIIRTTGGSLLITSSARTLPSTIAALENNLREGLPDGTPIEIYNFTQDKARPNPYLAYLGLADVIIAPDNSISMLSDAIATDKRVYVADSLPSESKTADLHKAYNSNLLANGWVTSIADFRKEVSSDIECSRSSAYDIAKQVRELLPNNNRSLMSRATAGFAAMLEGASKNYAHVPLQFR